MAMGSGGSTEYTDLIRKHKRTKRNFGIGILYGVLISGFMGFTIGARIGGTLVRNLMEPVSVRTVDLDGFHGLNGEQDDLAICTRGGATYGLINYRGQLVPINQAERECLGELEGDLQVYVQNIEAMKDSVVNVYDTARYLVYYMNGDNTEDPTVE